VFADPHVGDRSAQPASPHSPRRSCPAGQVALEQSRHSPSRAYWAPSRHPAIPSIGSPPAELSKTWLDRTKSPNRHRQLQFRGILRREPSIREGCNWAPGTDGRAGSNALVGWRRLSRSSWCRRDHGGVVKNTGSRCYRRPRSSHLAAGRPGAEMRRASAQAPGRLDSSCRTRVRTRPVPQPRDSPDTDTPSHGN